MKSQYKLGARSLRRLDRVHPDLADVVRGAIKLTTQDFSVHEGVRSAERQLELYRRGASKIDGIVKKGRHQLSENGFGHAVDLVPYVDGELRWEWELIFPICDAVKKAAKTLRVPIRWGGTWQEITATRYDGMSARQMFDANPSWDGAHFELPKRIYP